MTIDKRLSRSRVFPPGSRLALALEYDGTQYSGWQRQASPNAPTVQGCLEQALSKVADAPVVVQCAGRTDSGVHASHQVVHFDAPSARPEAAWVMGVNSNLPGDIAVKWVSPVPVEFNARFSATARRYRYIFYSQATRPALLRRNVTWIRTPLDAKAMHLAAQNLLGERDFSAFRAAGCQSRSPMRFVSHARVTQTGDFTVLDIKANAFLHHMVRNIAGTLAVVGRGESEPEWVASLMDSRDRTLAAATAPPNGLYLIDVDYPPEFALPATVPGPGFIAPLLD